MSTTTQNRLFDPVSTSQMRSAPQNNNIVHPISEADLQHARTVPTICLLPTRVHSQVERPTSTDDELESQVTNDTRLHDEHEPPVSHRRNVIKELIDTEITYTQDMRILLYVYKATADTCPALDAQAVQLIFRNADDILSVQTSFQSQLEKSVASIYRPSHKIFSLAGNNAPITNVDHDNSVEDNEAQDQDTRIGQIFMLNIRRITEVLEEFLKNSKLSIEYLAVIRHDPVVEYWMEQCRDVTKHLTYAWDLGSLLIKPVQRITRYPMLIAKLLRYTPQHHPDWKDLFQARELLNTLLSQINIGTKAFGTVPRPTMEACYEPETKPSVKRMLKKSVSRMRLWVTASAETLPIQTITGVSVPC